MAAAPSKRKGASCNTAVHISQLSPLQKKKGACCLWRIMFGTNALLDNFLLDAVPASARKALLWKRLSSWRPTEGSWVMTCLKGHWKKKENTIENEKATVLSAGLEVWRLVLMGVAEIVTRAASTSHDNPVAEFGCECNLQLLRWDSKQAATCTMLAVSWCSLWLKPYILKFSEGSMLEN